MINYTGDAYVNKDDGDANEGVDTHLSWTDEDRGHDQCLGRTLDSFAETNPSTSTAEQGQLGSVRVISQNLRSNLKLLTDYSYTYSSLMAVNDK